MVAADVCLEHWAVLAGGGGVVGGFSVCRGWFGDWTGFWGVVFVC